MKARSIAMVTLLALTACHTRTAADPSQEEKAAREVEQGKDDDAKDAKGDEDGDAKDAKDGDAKDGDAKDAKGDKDGDAKDAKGARHGATGGGAASSPARAASNERSGSTPSKVAKGEKKDDEHGDGIDPEEIQVSTSPQGLLKPGAEERVRQKLGVDKGKGMRAALRKFQREHDLPATGMVDHETVIQLGLEPSDIFEKAD